MIAEDITVVVLGVKGTQVRLGFAADSKVPIHREEVHERIKLERASLISSTSIDSRRDKGTSVRMNRGRRLETPGRFGSQPSLNSVVDE